MAVPFTFNINIPQNIEDVLENIKRDIKNGGGNFSGNSSFGSFSGKGVEASYSVGNYINIKVTKKPFIAPEAYVESEIRKQFSKYAKYWGL